MLGVTCVRRVEIVLVVVKIVEIIQLVHSVLVSLSAVRETMLRPPITRTSLASCDR